MRKCGDSIPIPPFPDFPRPRLAAMPPIWGASLISLRKTIRFTVCVPLILMSVMGILSPHFALAKPQRVVSMDRGADEYLMLLAQRKNIAALTWLVNKPDVSNVLAQAQGMPVTKASVEDIVLLKPDLVVGSRIFNGPKIRILKKLSIPCFLLETPESFDDIRKQTRALGEVLGEQEKAQQVLQEMDARLARIAAQHAGQKPKVVFYWSGGYTSGAGTMAHAMVEAAGGQNMGVQLGGGAYWSRGNARLSLENLILAKPDYIVFTNFRRDAPTVGRQIIAHPALRDQAIARHAYELPARIIGSTSPMAVQAVEMLQSILKGRASAALPRS